MRELFGHLKVIARFVTDILFPQYCIGCSARGTSLCQNCLVLCDKPTHNLPPWIQAYFSYKNPSVRKSIWQLKYKNNQDIARIYGQLLYDNLVEELAEQYLFGKRTSILLIPIPLSPSRLRERGFNQAELIARHIVACDTTHTLVCATHILLKKDSDIHQARTKGRRERLANIIDSFFIRKPDAIRGQTIILIDDVVTTGATLKEARKVLRQAGAKHITALTIAH